MENIKIIPTSAAEHIGKKLAKKQGLEVIFPEKNKDGKRYFPDGEVYARISRVQELTGRVVILHSGAPNPNDGLVELEMILETLKQSNIFPLEVFFLYFPYGKQDDIFQQGETNAAENLVKKLRDYYGVSRIYTIDAHFVGREWVNNHPLTNISAVNLLIKAALKDYPKAVLLPPDIGSERRTGMKLKGLEMKRLDSYRKEIKSDEEFRTTVKGKVVAALDDMVETGGTLAPFYEECIKCGAKKVIALVTHGVIPEGVRTVKNKYSRLYLTNTIDQDEANVDITDLVFKTITKRE